jgi:cytochrome c-type biogenesis protein
MTANLNIATAFLAGLVSFVSPCVLPLVPSYLSFLTGTSLEDLKAQTSAEAKARVLAHALAFCAGLTAVFVLLGLSSSELGSVLASNKDLIARVGGAVIIILGLNMIGLFRIPQLMMDKRVHIGARPQSLWLSFLVGVTFAAGWTPCIGPILGAILLLAGGEAPAQGAWLLFVYAMGLAIPFLVTAAAITQSLGALNRIKRFLPAIETASGAVLVATGLLLATGSFVRFQAFFNQYIPAPRL